MIDEDVTALTPDEVINKNEKPSVKHEYASAENEKHIPQPRKSNPKKTIALIGAGCIILLLCCCCSILFLSSQGIISEETIAGMCATIKAEDPNAETFGLCDNQQEVPVDIQE
jgi:hypothetical protein